MCHGEGVEMTPENGKTMDAADELAAMILERLDVLSDINASTFNSDHPTNFGPIERWIQDVRGRVTRFNLKGIINPANPNAAPYTPPSKHGSK